jgi:hypothetical protein
VLKSKPVFLWNLLDLKQPRWEGPELIPGKHVLEFDFKYDRLARAAPNIFEPACDFTMEAILRRKGDRSP